MALTFNNPRLTDLADIEGTVGTAFTAIKTWANGGTIVLTDNIVQTLAGQIHFSQFITAAGGLDAGRYINMAGHDIVNQSIHTASFNGPYSAEAAGVKLVRCGNVVVAHFDYTMTGALTDGQHTPGEVIPVGYRPTNTCYTETTANLDASAGRRIRVNVQSSGAMDYHVYGGTIDVGEPMHVTFTYITSNAMPNQA
jgi:hypothetical protein